MSFLANIRKDRRTFVIAGAAAAVLVIGGGIAAFAFANQAQQPEASPTPTRTVSKSPTPTPTPTPTPEPVALPAAAPVQGMLDGWQGVAQQQIADIMPQAGEAHSGQIAAYIDAPVVAEPTIALSAALAAEPGVEYSFSAFVRSSAPLPEEVAAAFVVGDTRIELPDLDASWTEVTGEFVAPEAATVGISIDGPVTGLVIDDVTITAAGGQNVVPNPSFEDVTSDWGIVNDSLILRGQTPVLGVNVAPGDATWRVTRTDGSVVAEGTATVRDGVSPIPLEGVTQGYYSVEVTDANGAYVSTPFAAVDYSGARIVPDDRLGVAMHADQTWYYDAADSISAVGFGLARNDVLWDQNERTPGVYEFSPHYVEEFDKLHSHGIGLLGIVNYGNPLYDGGTTPASPEAVEAFGRYAAAIAARFDVAGLEVFNEFNHERFNNGQCGSEPHCYTPLIESTQRHAAEVNPDIPIVAGSTANYPSEWFAALWDTGALAHTDAMSFHPYNKPVYDVPENLAGTIADANKNMEAHGGERKPIWITEFGWTTGNEMGQAVSDAVQAERLVRSEVTALAHGVEKFFWYDLVDDSRDGNAHEGNFGMFGQKRDGVSALPPKPAAFAQALLINELAGRGDPVSDDLGDGSFSHRFGTEDDFVRVAWTLNGEQEATIEVPGPVRVTDMSGATTEVEPEGGRITVTLGASPIFISTDVAAE